MTSKERVRKSIQRQQPDRIPANFSGTKYVQEKLMKHYGLNDFESVLQKFDIDIRTVEPDYIGPELKTYRESNEEVRETYWGFRTKQVWTGTEYYSLNIFRPLDECKTINDLKKYRWPSADWFDYESLKPQLERHKDKAISLGYPGPFQIVCDLRSMENLCMDMALDPEFAHYIYDRMVEFELEYYERAFEAAGGQIDILRTCDDYGTQINQLFSIDMWKEYFDSNTKKLVNLAHQNGAFFMQHSCGAIRNIIPCLIECGIDILDPIQKVQGMDPTELKREFGDKLAFQGGIDTQHLLPFGTVDEVKKETRFIIDTLGNNGGYILMASQGIQRDVPIKNIEAMFYTTR